MTSITKKSERVARFTSSEIYRLTTSGKQINGWGASVVSFIQEKRYEKRLGRGLNADRSSKPTSWGHLGEAFVSDIHLSLDDALVSKEPLIHPFINHWAGTPDLIYGDRVSDIKCPFTLKSFCDLVEAMESREALKDAFPDYYWQLVSNAIIADKEACELIVFCPYQSEAQAMIESINDDQFMQKYGLEYSDYHWMNFIQIDELPYLIEGNGYTNLNRFVFEVPEEDFNFLTDRVNAAAEYILHPHRSLNAEKAKK